MVDCLVETAGVSGDLHFSTSLLLVWLITYSIKNVFKLDLTDLTDLTKDYLVIFADVSLYNQLCVHDKV